MVYDVLVIGAGQAGLSIGYFLKKTNLSYLLLDHGGEMGESWRKRYDSLKLFTPRSYSSLPGLSLKGDPNEYPTKDEVAEYLSQYAKTFSLPVKLQTMITKLDKEGDCFVLSTNQGEYRSKQVIVATGPFQQPKIPEFSKFLSDEVLQLHSSEYKNPDQLLSGTAVVVGGGNSGAQIAVELADHQDVYLSVGHKPRFLPQDFGGKSIFLWFDKMGILKANVHGKVGQMIKNKPDPIFGFELKLKLKDGGVQQKTKAVSANENQLIFEDQSIVKVRNVIWSTGFISDYSWIRIPSLFNEKGMPIHKRGVTAIRGLYFLGLPWQYRRGSALLQGIGVDAEYLVLQIINNHLA
ncbi:putative flavoprotein involved in K+ transport [Cytobacillus oceanisediminis]|uniref:Putative flavoprotein involved in K+ transport n=1 Tax=Cytobacillus oceanisediminis TaxID=665099 RepID=A0A2V3A5M5_9BACI|nr:putative flavoprotein involved in K+ transport [Cytobacillus oceanisediminis]